MRAPSLRQPRLQLPPHDVGGGGRSLGELEDGEGEGERDGLVRGVEVIDLVEDLALAQPAPGERGGAECTRVGTGTGGSGERGAGSRGAGSSSSVTRSRSSSSSSSSGGSNSRQHPANPVYGRLFLLPLPRRRRRLPRGGGRALARTDRGSGRSDALGVKIDEQLGAGRPGSQNAR